MNAIFDCRLFTPDVGKINLLKIHATYAFYYTGVL